MNFGTFIERDMIEFLEREEEKKRTKIENVEEETDFFNFQQDYYQDLIRALDKDDLTKAKNIFDEVKGRFAKSTNKIEKKKLSVLLDDIYMEIKRHSKKKDSGKQLDEEVRELEEEGVFEKKLNEVSKQEKLAEEGRRQKIIDAVYDGTDKIKVYLEKRDLMASMIEYKTMKVKFDQFPEKFKEEKEKLFNEVITTFYQIKKLENDLQDEKETTTRTELKEKDKIIAKAKEITETITNKISSYLKTNNIKDARLEYKYLKAVLDAFPEEYQEEKKELYDHTVNIYNQIIELEKTNNELEEKRKELAPNKLELTKPEIEIPILKVKEDIIPEGEVPKPTIEKIEHKSVLDKLKSIFNLHKIGTELKPSENIITNNIPNPPEPEIKLKSKETNESNEKTSEVSKFPTPDVIIQSEAKTNTKQEVKPIPKLPELPTPEPIETKKEIKPIPKLPELPIPKIITPEPIETKTEIKPTIENIPPPPPPIVKPIDIKTSVPKPKSKDSFKALLKKRQVIIKTNRQTRMLTKNVTSFLKKRELKKSMLEYEKLKTVFEEFPKAYKQEKVKMYTHTLDVYNHIRQAEKIFRKKLKTRKQKVIIKPTKKLSKEERTTYYLKQQIHEVIQLLKNRQLEEANIKLLEIKHQITRMPTNMMEEKTKFEELVKEITHKINLLKQIKIIQKT